MTDQAERTFVEKVGQFYVSQYALAAVIGRVVGWLLICKPNRQTIDEIAEGVQASRSAVNGAVAQLEQQGWVVRARAAGERADRVAIDTEGWTRLIDSPEYQIMVDLAQEGLSLFNDPARVDRLKEYGAWAEFLVDRIPKLTAEWLAHRDALRASGELPE